MSKIRPVDALFDELNFSNAAEMIINPNDFGKNRYYSCEIKQQKDNYSLGFVALFEKGKICNKIKTLYQDNFKEIASLFFIRQRCIQKYNTLWYNNFKTWYQSSNATMPTTFIDYHFKPKRKNRDLIDLLKEAYNSKQLIFHKIVCHSTKNRGRKSTTYADKKNALKEQKERQQNHILFATPEIYHNVCNRNNTIYNKLRKQFHDAGIRLPTAKVMGLFSTLFFFLHDNIINR